MAFTFDGPNKLIICTAGTVEIDVLDLYSRWKDWVLLSDNSKYLSAFAPIGGDPIDVGNGIYITSYFFLQNGWKIRPQELSHTLNVTTGVLLTSDGSDPFVDTLGSYTVRIKFSQPVRTETVNIAGGGGGASVNDIWSEPVPAGYPEGSAGFKLGNLSSGVSGTAAINTVPSNFVLTTGIETNTYLDTVSENGVLHTLDDVGNTIDGYYEFNVGADGYPVEVSTHANLQSANDTLTVYAWNWNASEWRPIGTLIGTGGSGLSDYGWIINDSVGSVGFGANVGKVRVRFAGGSSNPRLDVDVIRLSFAVISRSNKFIGLAQGGTTNTITFPASASSVNDLYAPGLIVIRAGTGAGQSARIDFNPSAPSGSAYNGATKVATVSTPWSIVPDSTSLFTVEPWGSVRVSDVDSSLTLGDWTSTEREQIRHRLGIDGVVTAPSTVPSLGVRFIKNQAYNNFAFEMFDSTTHLPAAGLTVSAQRSIDGGAFAACANAVSEISNGWYKINLAATDVNGDAIILRFTATGADETSLFIATQSS